jgi:multidrug efflux pump subunit AcrA (membrane-fusion protein)
MENNRTTNQPETEERAEPRRDDDRGRTASQSDGNNHHGGNGRQQQDKPAAALSSGAKRWMLIIIVVAIVLGLLLGVIPHYRRNQELEKEARQKQDTAPTLNVIKARLSTAEDRLSLPGTISPIVEAAIFARASGYVSVRRVDIGDRVKKGQLLALIDAPDLDQQVDQARATLSQSQAALGQVKAQLNLALLTRDRFRVLVAKGVLARQDGDTQEANYQVAAANVESAENVIRANAANLDRLKKLQQYERVEAPFDGIVTARNVDVGSLISATGSGQGASVNSQVSSASTSGSGSGTAQGGEMFRVAQTNRLRVFIGVPESYVPFVKVGQDSELQSDARPQQKVRGKVTRTADSIDQNTRTLLTEVQIDNRDRSLLPGMYVTVSLLNMRVQPPVIVPADSLITRAQGTAVAIVRDNIVHLQPVVVGRDYGAVTEIVSGINEGDLVALTPSDMAREGTKVQVKVTEPPAAQQNAQAQTQKSQQSDERYGSPADQKAAPAQDNGQKGGDGKSGDGKSGKPPGKKK